jgi:hypothetical protein
VDNAAEVFSQIRGCGETALRGHRLDRQVTGLEQSLGQLDALML